MTQKIWFMCGLTDILSLGEKSCHRTMVHRRLFFTLISMRTRGISNGACRQRRDGRNWWTPIQSGSSSRCRDRLSRPCRAGRTLRT